jgi:hypothetical protein
MCAICHFRLDFGVSHPLALSVAVATRQAIESGFVEPIDAAEGALSTARLRMSAVEALNLLQARIENAYTEAALLAIPDFYVLLIENDTWGFFHATTQGFDPDIVPAMPDVTATDEATRSNVIVASETGLRAWLDGRVDIDYALRESLVVVDAPQGHGIALTAMLVVAGRAAVDAH